MNISSGDAVSARARTQVQPTVSPGVSENEFKTMLAEAKGRLENPLGTAGRSATLAGSAGGISSITAEDPADVATGGINIGDSGLGETDAFAGVDALNQRIFSEIYSTIQVKLDQLKQGQLIKENSAQVAAKGALPKSDIETLYLMASKVAEIYGTSTSVEYKKKAEKTLVKLITKLSTQAELRNSHAAQRLNELVGKLPPESVPGTVLAALHDEKPSDLANLELPA